MPGRSMVSANTACGSRPETKVFAQPASGAPAVAVRMARSGRKMAAAATNAASTSAFAIRLRETKGFLLAPGSAAPLRRLPLARLLGLANRRQCAHGDTRRRHVGVGHEEIRHQGHAGIDAVVLKIAHAARI